MHYYHLLLQYAIRALPRCTKQSQNTCVLQLTHCNSTLYPLAVLKKISACSCCIQASVFCYSCACCTVLCILAARVPVRNRTAVNMVSPASRHVFICCTQRLSSMSTYCAGQCELYVFTVCNNATAAFVYHTALYNHSSTSPGCAVSAVQHTGLIHCYTLRYMHKEQPRVSRSGM
jgi:hypothetical protein